jgi:hypothetical protein
MKAQFGFLGALAMVFSMGLGSVAHADDFPLNSDLEAQCKAAIVEGTKDLYPSGSEITGIYYDIGYSGIIGNTADSFGFVVSYRYPNKNGKYLSTTDHAATQLVGGNCVYVQPLVDTGEPS